MIKDHWYKIKDSHIWEYHGKFDYFYDAKAKELKIVNKDSESIFVKKIEFKEARGKVEEYETKKKKDTNRVPNNIKKNGMDS